MRDFDQSWAWIQDNKIPIRQVPFEIQTAVELLTPIGRARGWSSVLEIGAGGGGSLYAYSGVCAKLERAACVEIGFRAGGCIEALQRVIEELRTEGAEAQWVRQDSTLPATLEAVRAFFPDGVDVLHIDGNHTVRILTQDWENFGPLVRKGGVAVFHDTQVTNRRRDSQVDILWPVFRAEHGWIEICGGAAGFGIGILFV